MNKPTFETLEQELSEMYCMTEHNLLRFYGTPSYDVAKNMIVDYWRTEYDDEEIEEALKFVEGLKLEN